MSVSMVQWLVQGVGVPIFMLASFMVVVWRYFLYQTKRDNAREILFVEHVTRLEHRITELANGQLEVLVKTLRDTGEARQETSRALNHLAEVISMMPCVVEKDACIAALAEGKKEDEQNVSFHQVS